MRERLLNFLRYGCAHRETVWPMHIVRSNPTRSMTETGAELISPNPRHSISGLTGQERCLECGMFRFAEVGGARGEWLRDVSARKVVHG